MSAQPRLTHVVLMVAVITAAMFPVPALSQDSADTWQWRGSLYAFLPTIEGTTKFPTGPGLIVIDADALLDNLDFTFMAALEVSNGDWGGFTDFIYLDLGASKSGTREVSIGDAGLPAGVDMDASLDVKAVVWTIAGTYNLSSSERSTTQLLFGARLFDYEQALDWTFNGDIGSLPLPGRSGSRVVDTSNWDAIVGLRGRSALGADGKWFVPYHLDAGAGDSDLTWQAMAGIGYEFGWGSAVVAWRYLEYDLESGGNVEDANFNGPMFGASWQW